MYIIIWTDGIGGRFAKYCYSLTDAVDFVKTKDSDKILDFIER